MFWHFKTFGYFVYNNELENEFEKHFALTQITGPKSKSYHVIKV